MTKGDVVKFKEPLSDNERESRMVVIEDRDTRMLVIDVDFIGNPNWPIAPTSVYATSDLCLAAN